MLVCCSVANLCPTLSNPMDCSAPGFPVLHCLPEFAKLMSTVWMMPSKHLFLCRPLLLSSKFPSTGVFSNKSVLHIRWPKYWNFSFSIRPTKEDIQIANKYMKKSPCRVSREIRTKATMRCHYIPIRMAEVWNTDSTKCR